MTGFPIHRLRRVSVVGLEDFLGDMVRYSTIQVDAFLKIMKEWKVSRSPAKKEELIMQRVDMMIGPRNFATLKAEQFMQDVVSYYQVEDSADKLAGAMIEGGFGSVPILAKDGKVVGIVSEFDLLQTILEDKELANVTAGEIMTKGNVSITKDAQTSEIIHVLQNKHLIRVTVIDAQGRLVGIVARRDILLGYLRASKPIWTF